VYLIKIRGRISEISEVWVRQGSGGIGVRGGVSEGSSSGLGKRRGEDALKVGSKNGSNLIRGCGVGAVWFGEIGDSVFTVTFENGEVKEISIAITFNFPMFFCSLNVIHFLSILQDLMLVMELLLKGGILLRGMEHLIRKDLFLDGVELISSFGFESAPFLNICSQKTSFVRERSSRGSVPASLSNILKVLFQKPPVFKSKGCFRPLTIGGWKEENGSVVAVHHRQV
jgi:hypothetical protein